MMKDLSPLTWSFIACAWPCHTSVLDCYHSFLPLMLYFAQSCLGLNMLLNKTKNLCGTVVTLFQCCSTHTFYSLQYWYLSSTQVPFLRYVQNIFTCSSYLILVFLDYFTLFYHFQRISLWNQTIASSCVHVHW